VIPSEARNLAIEGRPPLEPKRYSVAAHYRNVDESDVIKVERTVIEVAARHRELRKIDNDKVYELQPDVDWDRGGALLWLLESLGREQPKALSIYIGDDKLNRRK
jgi:trehalose 6-phosphate phosphatase